MIYDSISFSFFLLILIFLVFFYDAEENNKKKQITRLDYEDKNDRSSLLCSDGFL
jgi:hypothetical protein